MKFNKTSIMAMIALGGLVTLSTIVNAEDQKPAGPAAGEHKRPGGPGGPGGEMRGKIAEELGLSEDQKAKMGEVMKEQAPKYKALREDTSLSKEDKMAKAKAIREEGAAKIKGILTPEQFEKWQKMQQNRRGPGGPRGEGKPPGEKPADKQ
jgi:Spy/CpxP family protein refolding chaperone